MCSGVALREIFRAVASCCVRRAWTPLTSCDVNCGLPYYWRGLRWHACNSIYPDRARLIVKPLVSCQGTVADGRRLQKGVGFVGRAGGSWLFTHPSDFPADAVRGGTHGKVQGDQSKAVGMTRADGFAVSATLAHASRG